MKKLLFLPLIFLLFFSACTTKPPLNENITLTEKVGDMTISMTYLTEDQLKKEFGYENNPFYNYPGKVPRKNIMVFDSRITVESTAVSFTLEDIIMVLDTGVTDNAKNRTTLLKAWKSYIKSDFDNANMKRTIKAELSENNFSVSPDKSYEGFIVFIINTKGATEAVISLPAETDSGEQGVINMPLLSLRDGNVAAPGPEGGFFSESK